MFPPDPRKGSLFLSALVISVFLAFGGEIQQPARSKMGKCGSAHAGRKVSVYDRRSFYPLSDFRNWAGWRHQRPMNYTSTPGDALFTG